MFENSMLRGKIPSIGMYEMKVTPNAKINSTPMATYKKSQLYDTHCNGMALKKGNV